MKSINKFQLVVTFFFLALVAYWLILQMVGSTSGYPNYSYSLLFGLLPLGSGLVGANASKIWGRFKSSLGTAITLISIGLVLWGIGELIWSYYNFFEHVAAPYPSLADIGFAPSIFFWVIGAAFLSQASGAWLYLRRSSTAKLFAITTICILTILSYFLLIVVARNGVLVPEGESMAKVVLDIAYPLGDLLAVIYAVIVFILS